MYFFKLQHVFDIYENHVFISRTILTFVVRTALYKLCFFFLLLSYQDSKAEGKLALTGVFLGGFLLLFLLFFLRDSEDFLEHERKKCI